MSLYEEARKARRAISVGHSVRACQSAAPSQHSNILLSILNVQTHTCHSLILHPLIFPDLPLKLLPKMHSHISSSAHLFNVHVDGHPLLGDPCHVLGATDVDLGDAIGWILVEHHRDVPRVLAPTHVLLVRALQMGHNYYYAESLLNCFVESLQLNSEVGVLTSKIMFLQFSFLNHP